MITPTGPTALPRYELRLRWGLDRLLIAAAIGWGIVILILAIVYPAESVNTGRPGVQPIPSLVAVNGYGVLLPAAIPLLIAIIVGMLHCARPSARWAAMTAWILSGALLLTGLVGFVTFLIGIYVLPAGALLVVALAEATSRRSAAASGPAPPWM
jgi:hypothetical protein